MAANQAEYYHKKDKIFFQLFCSQQQTRLESPIGQKSVIVSEVSSLPKCMQEWYILGVGKGVLFREVTLFQQKKCDFQF